MNDIAEKLGQRLFGGPLIQNQFRSTFVEAMLEPVLQNSGWKYTGDGWSGWDFERHDGARLEVKQSAAVQTWAEKRGNSVTKPIFSIAPKKGFFYDEGSKWDASPGRPADLYVFAWNAHGEHTDPANWEFFVVPTKSLPEYKTISLRKVKELSVNAGQHGPVVISELPTRVADILMANPAPPRFDTVVVSP